MNSFHNQDPSSRFVLSRAARTRRKRLRYERQIAYVHETVVVHVRPRIESRLRALLAESGPDNCNISAIHLTVRVDVPRYRRDSYTVSGGRNILDGGITNDVLCRAIDYSGDAIGNGERGVLASCNFAPPNPGGVPGHDEIFYFSPDGRLKWVLPCRPELLDFNGQPFEPTWHVKHILLTTAERGQIIWIAAAHGSRWPGAVLRVDSRGAASVQFANAGNVECLCRVPSQHGDQIVICGENDAFERAFAATFGANDPPCSSPVGGPPRYRYTNSPAGKPKVYLLFPTPELVTIRDAPYAYAGPLAYEMGLIAVNIQTWADTDFVQYQFSDRMEPRLATPSGGSALLHKRFEEQGRLKHTWAHCPEFAKPAVLQRWEPSTGWQRREVPWRLPQNTL